MPLEQFQAPRWARCCPGFAAAIGLWLFLADVSSAGRDEDRAAVAEQLKSASHSARTVQSLAPGVDHVHWHIVKGPLQDGPWNINALRADLSRDGVEVRVVPAVGGLETTSSIARRVGALAAVNGGYYDAGGPRGLVVVDGRIVSSTDPGKLPRAAVGFYDDKVWIDLIDQAGGRLLPLNPSDARFDWSKARYVLGAGPRIVWDRRVTTDWASEGFDREEGFEPEAIGPWTALGVRGNNLFLLTTDGGQPGLSIGWLLEQSAGYLIRECRAWRGMALAGGPATTLVIRGEVVNFPSGADAQGNPWVEQPVANAICVFSSEAKE